MAVFGAGTVAQKGRLPKSGLDYWQPKLAKNVDRDRAKKAELEALGWKVLVVWQCETADTEGLRATLQEFVEVS